MRSFHRRGLSLIELVVVIAIILLLGLAVFWVASKVRALVVALDPDGAKAVQGPSEKPAEKPVEKPDQQVPSDKKESPPK
jgi:prepilin-type N-terminal cleavage/methylation domain-containing protein